MFRRLLLCFAGLLLVWFTLAAAEADGELVSFSMQSKIGAVTVPPGIYRLKVQGSLVFLMEMNTKKSFSALVKVEKTAKKSGFTAAQGKTVEGTQHVEAIVLQGADYKLVF